MDFRNLDTIEKERILDYIISKFDLKPLPFEGGYFIETFRSGKTVFNDNLSGPISVNENKQLCKKNGPTKTVLLSEAEQLSECKQQNHRENRLENPSMSRSLSTSIIYLITSGCFSKLHRLQGEEIFHFYFGDPVTMLNICESGKPEILTLGNDFEKGEIPQHVVYSNCWQGAFLSDGKNPVFALLGTTMSPGFDLNDYESAAGYKDILLKNHPELSEIIKKLL